MKLLAKFSLIFTIVFGLGLTGAGYVFYDMLQRNAREQVVYQAHLMMDSAMATRKYTTARIKPALAANHDGIFRPESVPAFAATEIFEGLRANYPSYSYKEATLNPTNLRDKAVDWEEDIIRIFRGRAPTDRSPFEGERMTPGGKSVYLASPLRAAKSCLECHSTPDVAPPEMVKLYGPNNGFGWKEDEVIGAQIVSVPAKLADDMAARAFRQLMISLGVVGGVTLLVLNLVLVVTVVRPVRRFAIAADQISTGQMEVPELPVKGKDEISMLAAAFNRMHRSLAAAMRMLDEK
jgi:HAMP domain-containing protein